MRLDPEPGTEGDEPILAFGELGTKRVVAHGRKMTLPSQCWARWWPWLVVLASRLWPMVALAFVLAHDGLDLLAWAHGGLGLIHLAHGCVSPAAFAAWGLEHLSRYRSIFVRISTLPVQPKRQQHLA